MFNMQNLNPIYWFYCSRKKHCKKLIQEKPDFDRKIDKVICIYLKKF